MNLLIIDDDAARANSLRQHFVSRGFDEALIEIADCADAGRALLRERYFDVLILDVVLPKRRLEGRQSATVGLELLRQLGRSNVLRKPERIIGITAHSEDIASFREHFNELCHVIIEAPRNQVGWRDAIADSLTYTRSSKFSRRSNEGAIRIVTVHGIRTLGSWQARFQNLVARHTDRAEFYEYKYGYFSAIAFLLPPLRRREVARLRERLISFGVGDATTNTVVVCHSFGTYLVTSVLKGLLGDGIPLPPLTLVLCGSVLRADFDWSFLPQNARVINECGARDHVLLLSEAFAPSLGMAGRVGFHGFNGSRLLNRYYDGGHSLYFESDEFMDSSWIPLLADDWHRPRHIDQRTGTSFITTMVQTLAVAIGRIKDLLFRH
jgi:CheY-like chemotaxis protein